MTPTSWAPLILFAAGAGLIASWAFGGVLLQPDWALALLIAALLARRRNWPWIMPGVLVHDTVLYWSVFGCLPVMAALPYLIGKTDEQLGAGVPQRLLAMIIGTLPLLWLTYDVGQWLLTSLLIVPLWFLLVRSHGRIA